MGGLVGLPRDKNFPASTLEIEVTIDMSSQLDEGA